MKTPEDYLRNSFTGALVLISHDRRFLDNCTMRTVEVMLGHLYDYKVPYTQYVELRKERIAQQKAAYGAQRVAPKPAPQPSVVEEEDELPFSGGRA